MLVDSHCHLDFNDFEEDFDEILERARANGVTAMLNAGNNIDELDNQLALSEKYPFIYTAVGVHPDNASEYESLTAADLLAQTHHKKVVAIGECGLDYYYDNCPRDVQIKVFREHIKAAQESGLPLIIHTREAEEDTMSLLDEAYKEKPFGGEFHCITGSQKRLLVETDSPFLAPVPKRGRRNEPAFVLHTAERLAQLRDLPLEKLAQITSDNFYRLFRKASDKGRYDYK